VRTAGAPRRGCSGATRNRSAATERHDGRDKRAHDDNEQRRSSPPHAPTTRGSTPGTQLASRQQRSRRPTTISAGPVAHPCADSLSCPGPLPRRNPSPGITPGRRHASANVAAGFSSSTASLASTASACRSTYTRLAPSLRADARRNGQDLTGGGASAAIRGVRQAKGSANTEVVVSIAASCAFLALLTQRGQIARWRPVHRAPCCLRATSLCSVSSTHAS
jgi:hypothetical protein